MEHTPLNPAGEQKRCPSCSPPACSIHALTTALRAAQEAAQQLILMNAFPTNAVMLPASLTQGAVGSSAQHEHAISISSADEDDMYNTSPPPSPPATDRSPDGNHTDTTGPMAAEALVAADGLDGRWYAITVGRDPGVYHGSHHVTPNVSGIPGGIAQKYGTKAEAETAYDRALQSGQVVQVTLVVQRTVLLPPTDISGRT